MLEWIASIAVCLQLGSAPVPQQEAAKNLQIFQREEIASARKLALVCAVDEYDDSASLRRLEYAEKDAKDVCARLEKGGFSVRLLIKVTTRKKLLTELDALVAVAGERDTLLFYFSGHGFGAKDGTDKPVNYVMPATADPADLTGSAVSIDEIATRLKSGKAKRCMIFVDACRNDPFTRAPNASFFDIATKEAGIGYLFATRPGSVSFEPEAGLHDFSNIEMKNGVFTHFVLAGLDGAAESNGDGIVSFTELADFVGHSLQLFGDAHRSAGKYDQVPYAQYDGPAGSDLPILIVAKPAAVAVTPVPAPAPEADSDAAPESSVPRLMNSTPDGSQTLESATNLNLRLEFDQAVNSVYVGKMRLQLDATRRIATGNLVVPTGSANYSVDWKAVGANRLEATGTLTWSVKTIRVTPFEAFNRHRNWTGSVTVRGQHLTNMTVTIETQAKRISTSPVSFDRSGGKFTLAGSFNGQALDFHLRGHSKLMSELLGVKETVVKTPGTMSDDGSKITGSFVVDTNVIAEYTLSPN